MKFDFSSEILSHQDINKYYCLTRLSKPENITIIPGQFLNIKILSKTTDPLLRRPFSPYKVAKNEIEILYLLKGKGTRLLREQVPGAKVSVLAPLGNTFTLNSKAKNLIFVAGGVGIAPLAFLANHYENSDKKCNRILLYGVRDISYSTEDFLTSFTHMYMASENTKDKANCFIGSVITLLDNFINHSKDLNEFQRINNAGILDEMNNNSDIDIFVCGPDPMLASFNKWNEHHGYDAELSLESFMGCGFHACLGCAVKSKENGFTYVCHDGPVVKWNTIEL